jgi:sterol desaturase/sphingolipid hydroxylase (fatty acid hydroxylase superfamily)
VSAISIFGPVAHSNLHLRLPRLAHRLVLTPQLHRLHHSIEPAARGNYTNVLPVWDLLFGTFVDPDRVSSTAVGVPDDPMPPTFLGQVAAPFAGAPVPSSP